MTNEERIAQALAIHDENEKRRKGPIEPITVNGLFIGRIESYRKILRGGRLAKRVYFCYLPSGERTEFSLLSRKKAVEWLCMAAAER